MSEQITDIDDATDVVTKSTKSKKAASPASDGRRMVTIHTNGESGGQNAVNICANGVAYNIPRGVPCPLPEVVIDGLANATEGVWREVNREMVRFEVPRFSYTVS